MNSTLALMDRCLTYMNCQLGQLIAGDKAKDEARPRSITLSRQAGARAVTIGDVLARYLQEHDATPGKPWTLFDKALIQKVLEEHKLPRDLDKFMAEKVVGEVEGLIGEILGLHPSLWSLHHKITDTIYKLARSGHVILVGRGANLVCASLDNVFHVRLVGSEEKRIRHLMAYHGMDPLEAEKYLHEQDTARAAYVRKHFDRDIDDPLIYDIVINTDHLTDIEVVRLIAAAVLAENRKRDLSV